MGALALFALFGLAGALVVFTNDDDDDTTEPADDTVEGRELDISTSGSFTGTDGNDTVSITGGGNDVSLETGAGDDTVLGSGTLAFDASQASVSTGAGDDLIDLNLDSSSVHGGEGNDTITVRGAGSDVFGDAGDDLIDIASEGDVMNAYGGEGNDTLQSGPPVTAPYSSSASDNLNLYGGDGDDLIYVNGPSSSTTGFIEVGHGGAGNDTIVMTSVRAVSSEDPGLNGPIIASGGEGEDTFVIRTHETITGSGSMVVENVGQTELPQDSNSRLGLFRIEDFESGVDTLSIDADAVADSSTLAEAHLEEVVNRSGATDTQLILVYETTDQQAEEIRVTLSGATGVTWNDVEFVGNQVPALTSIA
ncbi:hypothetical protein GCM10007385_42720 [Tateyamaria omphalii]|uniref:calcium-binding protein n=1 Tax=Tateyamaria omphalii TaxID=299262 RepID=UPI0019954124|nr:hypothetical protein [Tateyamaria omphalii]GGX68944.1 hypothetical protein GCM10007385_42720 [Tateyamaria omphalii]